MTRARISESLGRGPGVWPGAEAAGIETQEAGQAQARPALPISLSQRDFRVRLRLGVRDSEPEPWTGATAARQTAGRLSSASRLRLAATTAVKLTVAARQWQRAEEPPLPGPGLVGPAWNGASRPRCHEPRPMPFEMRLQSLESHSG